MRNLLFALFLLAQPCVAWGQFTDLTAYKVFAGNTESFDENMSYASVNDPVAADGYNHGSALYKGKGKRIYMGAPSPLSGYQAAIADSSTYYKTNSPNPLSGSNNSWADVDFQKVTPNAYDMMRCTVLISAELNPGTGSFNYYTIGAAGRVTAELEIISGTPYVIFKIAGTEVKRIPDLSVNPYATLTFPFEYIITEDLPIADVNCTSFCTAGGQATVEFDTRATADVQAFDSNNNNLPTITGTPISQPPNWPQGTPWYDPIFVGSFQADHEEFPELDFTPLDEIEYEDYGEPVE